MVFSPYFKFIIPVLKNATSLKLSDLTQEFSKQYYAKGVTEYDLVKYINNKEATSGIPLQFIIQYTLTGVAFIASLMEKYDVNTDRSLNVKKFSRDISPYIDYYTHTNSPDFPKVNNIYKNVEYSTEQLGEWNNLVRGIYKQDNISKLNENQDNDSDNEFFKITNDNYLDNGRVIGNLSHGDTISPKFVKILTYMRKSKGNTLVYSSFYKKGILLFSDFLKKNNVKHDILTPKMNSKDIQKSLYNFKKGTDSVLLLHPKFTEGISVLGVEHFHILEPLLEKNKKDQLVGRTVRYKSHVHLPSHRQNVNVINWVSSGSSVISILYKKIIDAKIWVSNYKRAFFTEMPENFDNYYTPDSILSNREQESIKISTQLEEILLKVKHTECPTGETFINKCDIYDLKNVGNCRIKNK